jgi:hypothetical protein
VLVLVLLLLLLDSHFQSGVAHEQTVPVLLTRVGPFVLITLCVTSKHGACRGGGGFSYGLETSMVLPAVYNSCSFHITSPWFAPGSMAAGARLPANLGRLWPSGNGAQKER